VDKRVIASGSGPRPAHTDRWLDVALGVSVIALATVVTIGSVVERSARTPLVRVSQPAPEFTLPSTDGTVVSLASMRGHPVILAFVPSALCNQCRQQLRALQEAFPALHGRGAMVFVVSVDSTAQQRSAARDLSRCW